MIRCGVGFDAHAFTSDRPLVLGGVHIPDSPGLAGHSDADVLCHAVADALLGAARLGDLGSLFPNDERWRNSSSLTILEHTVRMLDESGWSIVNIDVTVMAEGPRLSPHREAMIDNVAGALGVSSDRVWVKGTTTDGLGFTGRGEGMAAVAGALIEAAGESA